ncbi:MAG TPA: hypothetical protein VFX41_05415 [Actinomycetales bacterium]|nr:hypothetical protein [Actinomycetales bacterium]
MRGLSLLIAAAAAAAVTSACAGEEPAPQSTVTVTQTQTPSAVTVAEEKEVGDVRGRGHDIGTIVSVKEVAGQKVLELDRWTLKGMDDAKLAREGAPVAPNAGDRFFNQNDQKTYMVPVAPDARLVVNECSAPPSDGGTSGLTSKPGDLGAFLSSPDVGKQAVMLTYSDGMLVQLDTDPVCR